MTQRRKYRTANMTADEAARKWADYMRLRRRPQKECRTCKHVYPNTLEHFAAGLRGRVGVRCHLCVAAHPVPTRLKQNCPCCGDFVRLVRDRNAPSTSAQGGPVAVFMCLGCLRVINGLIGASQQTREHMLQYVSWRSQIVTSSQLLDSGHRIDAAPNEPPVALKHE